MSELYQLMLLLYPITASTRDCSAFKHRLHTVIEDPLFVALGYSNLILVRLQVGQVPLPREGSFHKVRPLFDFAIGYSSFQLKFLLNCSSTSMCGTGLAYSLYRPPMFQ